MNVYPELPECPNCGEPDAVQKGNSICAGCMHDQECEDYDDMGRFDSDY